MELIPSRCGVCNHDIPVEHACYHRLENDMTTTSYTLLALGNSKI